MGFRYDIGALRALAVAIVILFHFKVPGFDGGFIGVDIFFVISGYLMTRIILVGFRNARFSTISFYQRRIKRILPALLFLVLCVYLFAFFSYFPNDFKLLAGYGLSSVTFVSNMHYALKAGYFNASSQLNALLHTWSLSVEWQFYMIYPIILLISKNWYLKKKREFFLYFSLMTIISFSSIFLINHLFSRGGLAFYLVVTRGWEMLLGGYAFLYAEKLNKQIELRVKNFLVLIAFVALGICVTFYSESLRWPSWYTLVPVIATTSIIVLEVDFKIFRNKSIQFMGDISYSLYLWHWPIYVFFLYRNLTDGLYILLMIVLSFMFACVSYYWVELRFKNATVRSIIVTGSIICAITGAGILLSINAFQYPKTIVELSAFRDNYEDKRVSQFNSRICHNTQRINYDSCLCVDKRKKNILLLGDSHAGHFSLSMRNRFNGSEYHFLEQTVIGALPLLNGNGRKESVHKMDTLLNEFIPNNKQYISLVLLSANWINFKGNRVELLAKMKKTAKMIESHGINVRVIGQTEVYNVNFPVVQAIHLANRSIKQDFINKQSQQLNDFLKSHLSQRLYVNLLNISDIEHYDQRENTPYMFDFNHYTMYGADQVVEYLIKNDRLF